MKKLFCFFIFFIIPFLYGCPAAYVGNDPLEIVETHAQLKDVAFDRTMQWIASNYNSAQNVVQYQDKNSGTIIIKAIHDIHRGLSKAYFYYTLNIQIKDYKIKFIHQPGEGIDIFGRSEHDMKQINERFYLIKEGILTTINTENDF